MSTVGLGGSWLGRLELVRLLGILGDRPARACRQACWRAGGLASGRAGRWRAGGGRAVGPSPAEARSGTLPARCPRLPASPKPAARHASSQGRRRARGEAVEVVTVAAVVVALARLSSHTQGPRLRQRRPRPAPNPRSPPALHMARALDKIRTFISILPCDAPES